MYNPIAQGQGSAAYHRPRSRPSTTSFAPQKVLSVQGAEDNQNFIEIAIQHDDSRLRIWLTAYWTFVSSKIPFAHVLHIFPTHITASFPRDP